MGGGSRGGRDTDTPAAFTLLKVNTLEYEMRRWALTVTGTGMSAPASVTQVEIIYLNRWGWNQSAAGRGLRLSEFRLFLWPFNEFIRYRGWAARKPEHGCEMRAVTVSLVHTPPAFQNNFQSSDKSVTAESVRHKSVPSFP